MQFAFLAEDTLKVVDPVSVSLPQNAPNQLHNEHLFYDWLDDENGCIAGLELHLDDSHPLAQALRNRSYVTFNPYPQLWFGRNSCGAPRGLEAFGDIMIFAAGEDNWCVIVSSDWLNDEDREELKRLMK